MVEFYKPDNDRISSKIIRSFKGGKNSLQLSQSKIVSDPDSLERNVFVLAADDDAKGTIVWNLKSNYNNPQVMSSRGHVVAVEVMEATQEKIKFASLLDKKISIFSAK